MTLANHRVISTTTVRPLESGRPGEYVSRFELTPSDLQLLLVDQIQKGLLFRKPKEPGDFVGHLKRAFSQALAIFYPLAGRLAIVQNGDDTVSFFVDCEDVACGAMFVHAAADGVSVADVLEPEVVPDDVVYSFFPMNWSLNREGVSKPLLAAQITELADGVFIACTMNHTVIDGTSFWQFFNTWSRISRGHSDMTNNAHATPVTSRTYLDGIIELPIRFSSPLTKIPDINFVNPPLQQRMFHFSKQKIAELKGKANAEMATDKISSLQALMAHLWVSVTRNRHLNASEEVIYRVIVGLRPRMDPPLPEQYLGNAVVFATAKSTAGELLERGASWAAWEINKTIASQTGTEVRKFLQDWAKSPSIIKKGLSPNTLITGSSPRFDVYGNDFGWGKPVAVRSGPGNKLDGKLTVFAGAEEGSIDFEACLSVETLEAMARDEVFMRTLATPAK